MMNRVLSVALAALVLVSIGSGCCCTGMNGCGIGCEPVLPGCGTGCGGCSSCDAGCGVETAGCGVEADCCDSGCDGGACQGDYYCWSPLRGLHNMLTCKSGCSGIYWDEWINEPPAECDPCDQHGNFVGGQCCWPNDCFSGLRRFFCGVKYDCCDQCSHGSGGIGWHEGGEVISDEVIHPEEVRPLKVLDVPPKPMLDQGTRKRTAPKPRVRYTASRTRR